MKEEVEKKEQKEISADMYRQRWTEETGCHCAQQGAQNRRLSAQVMREQALEVQPWEGKITQKRTICL
jgi:hypothetical protein